MKVLNFNDPYVDSKGNVNNLGDVLTDTAVKESIVKLNSNLSNKTKFSLELGDIKWVDGGNIESTTWKRSGFVKVTPNTKYTLNRTQTEHMNIIGYKEDKTVITDGTTVIGVTSAIIEGAKTSEFEFTTTPTTNYIRIAITDTNLSENITLINNGIGNTVVELVEDVAEINNDLSTNNIKFGKVDYPFIVNGTDNGQGKLLLDYSDNLKKIVVYYNGKSIGNISIT